MSTYPSISELIPHREPFLFVDEIVSISENAIETEFVFGREKDFFRGHYPHMPIVPGVLISEAVFQSAAIFISYQTNWANGQPHEQENGTPVLTRIKLAKFKHMVKPDDKIEMMVNLEEAISNAWYMKGKVTCNNNLVLNIDFTVGLVKTE